MGEVFLADGRECKLVTGIDDHSRFVAIATVVTSLYRHRGHRAVCTRGCAAFTAAMARYGVPSEVDSLTSKERIRRRATREPRLSIAVFCHGHLGVRIVSM